MEDGIRRIRDKGAKLLIIDSVKATRREDKSHPYQYIAGPSSPVEGVQPNVTRCVAG
jgi:hypothetical protein